MGEGGNLLNILHVTCSALNVVFHFTVTKFDDALYFSELASDRNTTQHGLGKNNGL